MRYKLCLFIASLLLFTVAAKAQLVQKIYTLAGNGIAGFSGDGSNASGASLWGPIDVALDGTGDVYVCDHFNNRVRKINAIGLITTIAGNGTAGNSGNGSIGTSASMVPRGIAVAKTGDLYISDNVSCVIRKVNNLGLISAFAGLGAPGYTGDGGPASAARLWAPSGITFDSKGNLYVADMGNHVVRKIDASGMITTVAGSDTIGFAGDNGPATAARLDSPYAVAVDIYGDIFIDDYGNNVIRMVDTFNNITTYAGMPGVKGYSGDGAPAGFALLNQPRGLAVDSLGNLYISDASNNVIREVTASTGFISTVVGNGTFGFGGDLGYVTGANLFNPYGIAIDASGSIYIADANNERVRKTYYPNLAVNNIATTDGIHVYPNPGASTITVSGLQVSDIVSIYDAIGRQVTPTWEVSGNVPQTYNISDLTPGMYLLKVCGANGGNKTAIRLVKE